MKKSAPADMTSKLMVAVLTVGTLAGTAGAGPDANRIVVAEGYKLGEDKRISIRLD